MIKKFIIIVFMFGLFNKTSISNAEVAHNFKFVSIDGQEMNLSNYKDKVLIVVNVASRCGFTSQYEGLQEIWDEFKDKNVVVIGVPSNNFKQEPGSNREIKDFCEANFNISFPMTEKMDVIGNNAHPFFIWAKESYGKSAIPKWNFHKIIVGKDGRIAKTFSSITSPSSKKFRKALEDLI